MLATAVLKNVFDTKYPKANIRVISINNPDDTLDTSIMLNGIDGYMVISDGITDYYILATYSASALDDISKYLVDSNIRFTESRLTWRLCGFISMLSDNHKITTNIKILEDLN